MSTVANKPGQDPTLPNVKLEVDGKAYQLAYDFNAVVLADQVTGLNLLESVVGRMTASSLRGLLWAALLKDQPDMTITQAGDLIRPYNLDVIRQAITTAWFGSVPTQDDAPGEATESPAA